MDSLARRIWSFLLISAVVALAGCGSALRGGPDRLEPVQAETDRYRKWVPTMEAQYYEQYGAMDESTRITIRNEIIAQRMYMIDVQYTTYESGLTRDRQVVGFFAGTTMQGLSAAGTVISPGDTTRILAGATSFVSGAKGYYDSEIIIAKTVQILQTQMRASRANVAGRILGRFEDSTRRYPLSLAMTDIEEYYRAGTLTSGLVEAAATVSAEKDVQETAKDLVFEETYAPDHSSEILYSYLFPNGSYSAERAQKLNEILRTDLGTERIVQTILDGAESAELRVRLIAAAKRRGIAFP